MEGNTTNAKDILAGLVNRDEEEARLDASLLAEWKAYEDGKKDDAKPFTLIKRMFTDSKAKWESMTDYEKAKHAFMVNRTFAIHYPVSANNLNGLKTEGLGVVETWRRIATGWRGVPNWIYTKTAKAEKTDPLKDIGKETRLHWMRENECGEREMYAMYELNGEEFIDALKYIEDYILGGKSTIKEKPLKKRK